MSQGYLTQAREGPVNVLAWWDTDDAGTPLGRGVMTNLPANGFPYRRGNRRMSIETVVRDWQSGGLHLDRSGLTDRQRFVRLLLALVIAYRWFVRIGRWVVQRGYRRLIDAGTARGWQYRLFHLGVGWMQRLQSYAQPLPVLLYSYM